MAFVGIRSDFYLRKLVRKLRERRKRSKATFTDLTPEQRKANSKKAQDTIKAVWSSIREEWRRQDIAVAEIAAAHNKSVAWVKARVQHLPNFRARRNKVSPYNALLHVRALEINEGHKEGDRIRLRELQGLAKNTEDWRNIPKEELTAMIDCVEHARLQKNIGSRSHTASRAHDIKNTIKHVQEELRKLDLRCQTASVCFTVRTAAIHTNTPRFYMSSTLRDFFEMVLNINVEEFCLKLESYAMLGLKGVAKNDNDRRCLLKRRVRGLVQERLREITKETKLDMCWEQYEEKIVNQYHVVLEGWPADTFNPGKLGTQALHDVLHKLTEGFCFWRRLSEQEFVQRQAERAAQYANGELRVKKRKRRSDAGKPRGKCCDVMAGGRDGTEDSENGSGNDTDTGVVAKRQRRMHGAPATNARTMDNDEA